MDNFKLHAETSGSEILSELVNEVTKHEDHFHVTTAT
jgi:thioredoxin reductase